MKDDKNIEDFSKYVVKEAGLETPSSNFVFNIMSAVHKVEKINPAFIYKPIISNKSWLIIGVLLTAICSFFVLNSSNLILSKYSYLFDSYVALAKDFYASFNSISLSPLTVLSFFVFTFFVLIQLIGIKNLFNKKVVETYSS